MADGPIAKYELPPRGVTLYLRQVMGYVVLIYQLTAAMTVQVTVRAAQQVHEYYDTSKRGKSKAFTLTARDARGLNLG